jgi:type IV pilus assembly protein PilA
MILKLRQRMTRDESGFTLVELLVVMLILGLLAAIAIPAFFNQRNKAKDASAKAAARTAETAMETYATDNGGVYNSQTPANTVTALKGIESTLTSANLGVSNLAAKTYTVTVTSSTGNTFSVTRNTNGTTVLSCTPASTDGCPAPTAATGTNGDWGAG